MTICCFAETRLNPLTRYFGSSRVFAALLLLFALCAIAAYTADVTKIDTEFQNDYSSPKTVFDSYRSARDKRDFRRIFQCHTPVVQRNLLWNIFHASGLLAEHRQAEARRIQAQYVGDPEKIRKVYDELYRAKYGRDPGEPPKKRPEDTLPNLALPADVELLQEAIFRRVQDKAGFYAAYENFNRGIDRPLPIGALQNVVVTGNTAIGEAKHTMVHIENAPPAPPKKIYDEVNDTHRFTKINGKWLMDH